MEVMKNSFLWTALLVGLSLFASGCQTVEQQPEPMDPEEIVPSEPEEPEEESPPPPAECRETKLEYKDGAQHEPGDDKVLARAKVRCGQLYAASPCVRVFTKLGRTTNVRYRVRCGRPG